MIKASTLDYIKESFKKNEFVEKPTCLIKKVEKYGLQDHH